MWCRIMPCSECSGCMRCEEKPESEVSCDICKAEISGDYYEIDGMSVCEECVKKCRKYH